MRTFKVPGSMQRGIGPSVAICGNSVLPFSKVLSLHQSNIYMKRKIREWRAENVILNSVHKAHLAVRTFKVPNSMQRGIGPSVAICENSGLRFAMVPSFHQSNIYIKRKLRKWSAHKCNPYFRGKSPPRSADLQNTRFNAARYQAVGLNLRKFGATVRHCTVFAPKKYSYQKEATGLESSKM